MGAGASQIAFIDYIEQYYRKKVEETGREWWNKRAHCARWSVRTQSAPASIGGNVCRIWKATADGRVCRAACASVETYQSSPNILSDILDMKGIMQTPVTRINDNLLKSFGWFFGKPTNILFEGFEVCVSIFSLLNTKSFVISYEVDPPGVIWQCN